MKFRLNDHYSDMRMQNLTLFYDAQNDIFSGENCDVLFSCDSVIGVLGHVGAASTRQL